MQTSAVFARSRVEPLIASTRVLLAASSLFGIWLDPAEPARFVDLTNALHVAYLAYALLLAAVMWRRDSSGRLPLIIHFIDIAVASVLQYMTLGPSSPFFTYFVFALFSAAIRWGWRATVQTAIVVLATFIVIAGSLSRTLEPAEFEGSRFVIRAVYLVVVTIVLVFLGQHEARLREEIRRLARWPDAAGDDRGDGVRRVVDYAAGLVGARGVQLLWTEDDEPWLYHSKATSLTKHAPGALEPVVPPALADAAFVCQTPLNSTTRLRISRNGAVAGWVGLPVHPSLADGFARGGFASAPFTTSHLSGRVFFTELAAAGGEMLPLLEVVGREVGASLEHLHAARHRRELAVAEGRIQVARDLHDGLLQSLTGIRLELRNVADRLRASGEGLQDIGLQELERVLAVEQRELRRLIEGLRPGEADNGLMPLSPLLDDLKSRLVVEWQVPIEITTEPPHLAVTAASSREASFMIREAVVNAVKHGHSSIVRVTVRGAEGRLNIAVADDGHGFAFVGKRDHAAVMTANGSPRSLRDRVVALGGEMSLESGPGGARVELSIPMDRPA